MFFSNLHSQHSFSSSRSIAFCCGYNTNSFLGVHDRDDQNHQHNTNTSSSSSSDLLSLVHLEALEKEMRDQGSGSIIQVATQFSTSYFLTSNHHVYCGDQKKRLDWPDLLSPDQIIDIKTGQNGALFLTLSGKVYKLEDHPDLAVPFLEQIPRARMIGASGMCYWMLDEEMVLHGVGDLNSDAIESPLNLKSFLEVDEDVAELVTGGNSICLITTKRNLYVMGEKESFGISDSISDRFNTLSRLHRFDGIVNKVSCGWYFTIVLTTDEKLFGAGRNSYGQLNPPNPQHQRQKSSSPLTIDITPWVDMTPHLPPGEYIENICCGSDHIVIGTNKGKVYTKGMTTYGQIGRPRNHDVFDLPNYSNPNYEELVKNAVGENYMARFATNNFNTLSTYVIFVPSLSKQITYFKDKLKIACSENKLSDLIVVTFDV